MEFINKIELQGVVGAVHITRVGDEYVARFSLLTEQAYKDQSGMPVIDSTWHACIVWSNVDKNATEIAKGNIVHLVGRIRQYKYTMADGRNITGTEVVASEIDILKEG